MIRGIPCNGGSRVDYSATSAEGSQLAARDDEAEDAETATAATCSGSAAQLRELPSLAHHALVPNPLGEGSAGRKDVVATALDSDCSGIPVARSVA